MFTPPAQLPQQELELSERVYYVTGSGISCPSLLDAERVQFKDLCVELENTLDGGVITDIGNMGGYIETYKWVRQRCGSEPERVTHWTTDYDGCDNDQRNDELCARLADTILSGEYIASGYYSTVFNCPWDRTKVIKLGRGGNFDGEIFNDGWLRYAAFCIKENYDRKYPIFLVVHNISIHDEFYVALLDKFDSTIDLAELSDKQEKIGRAIQCATSEYYRNSHEEWQKEVDMPTYHLLQNLIEEHGLKFNDLHDGNIMINENDETIVIVDPDSRSCYGTKSFYEENGLKFAA